MGVTGFFTTGLPGEFFHQFHVFQVGYDLLDLFKVGESIQTIGAAADFTGGLRPAQQKNTDDGLLAGHQLKFLGKNLFEFGNPADVALSDQLTFPQTI
jgi:hypothetical protein